MKIILLAAAMVLAVSSAVAKDKKPVDTNSTPEQVEAKYTAAIEVRTADILKLLDLNDTNKFSKVHDTIIAQYRALNAWHNENDEKLKVSKSDTNAVAQIRASLKAIHNDFLSKLGENLSPEQVEKVKDKMTYGKVQFTFKGYLIEYPDMTETQQAEVMRLLKDAREEAMDGGSADEKSAIFNRYKGKINIYLSKQGIHSVREKTKSKAADTNSVSK